MKKNKEYKQIFVNQYCLEQQHDLLKGKVVDKVAFNNRSNCEDQHQFIITFTDKTFVAIGLDYNEDDDMYVLEDMYVSEPECINGGRLDTYIDSEGKLRLDRNFQQLVDLGIYDVTIEEVAQRIKEHNKRQEEREYDQYLRLKAKFEKNG